MRQLEHLISRRMELMQRLIDRAKSAPKRIVFPEGENEKILRTAKILVDQGMASRSCSPGARSIEAEARGARTAAEAVTITSSTPRTLRSSRRYAAVAARAPPPRRA